MFPQQPQQQFRTAGADVKNFYGAGGVANANQITWNKPAGVSHIYMMLIGGGGTGNGTIGGGSGAVTVWYGASQNVPDSLVVAPSRGFSTAIATTVTARFSNSALTPTALLTANSGSGGTAGAAMTANQFTVSGFFQSVAGQNGTSGNLSSSTTTFLSGGLDGGTITANYGYVTVGQGFFQMQPIIVGVGGAGIGQGGIGCGSGESASLGGQGFVLIASW